MIAINNRASSSSTGAELLRIPPWMKEAAMVVDDDDDGLLSGSSDERGALALGSFFEVFMTFSQFLLRHSLHWLSFLGSSPLETSANN